MHRCSGNGKKHFLRGFFCPEKLDHYSRKPAGFWNKYSYRLSQPYAVCLVLLDGGENLFRGKSLDYDRKIHCHARYYDHDIVA